MGRELAVLHYFCHPQINPVARMTEGFLLCLAIWCRQQNGEPLKAEEMLPTCIILEYSNFGSSWRTLP